jgi:DNA topoisomerase-3
MNRPDVDCVVNGCDSGREGENIFRLTYHYAHCDKPVMRLWVNSMEESALRHGFDNLRDGVEYDNLYAAASCRERADWLVGISATRLFSVLYGGVTLNVGRVQTPTLAMLTEREAEIANFVSTPFYTVELGCGGFAASSERFTDKADAEKLIAGCSTGSVSGVKQTEKSVAPPKLFDLTALQRECNRVHGFTAQQTLDYLQSLYEKKLASYPRSDSRYLTDDMAKTVMALVAALLPDAPCSVAQVIDPVRVSDHHAVIPTMLCTTADLSALPSGERTVLDMLKTRLVCAVGEPHRYLETIVTLTAGGAEFQAKGKTVIHSGWKSAATPGDSDDEDAPAISNLSEGAQFPVTAALREGATKPPKHFTEDTLLSRMESAGAGDISEEVERKGLGMPATRAGIIEKLIKSGLIERSKKNLRPSDKGKLLITVLPDDLKSPKLTAMWESMLRDVENRTLNEKSFMDNIEAFIREIVRDNSAPKAELLPLFANQQKFLCRISRRLPPLRRICPGGRKGLLLRQRCLRLQTVEGGEILDSEEKAPDRRHRRPAAKKWARGCEGAAVRKDREEV